MMVDVVGSTPQKAVIKLTDGPFKGSVLIISDIGLEFERNKKTNNSVMVNRRMIVKVPNKARLDWIDFLLQNMTNFVVNKCDGVNVRDDAVVTLQNVVDAGDEQFLLDLTKASWDE